MDKLSTWALFFPDPMDEVDFANLATSGVKRAQLFLGTASDVRQADQLKRLAQAGVRVSLRIEEPNVGQEAGTYYDSTARASILARVAYVRSLVPVEAVIVGNEPDGPYDLRFGSPDWGQQRAYQQAAAVGAMRSMLGVLGVKVVSPGLQMRSISEDEVAAPGQITWREIVDPEYAKCDANGAHVYTYGWQSDIDRVRVKFALKRAMEMWHKPVWINELGVDSGSQVERMQAYVEVGGWLFDPAKPFGSRIESMCPFVSNGSGQGYDPGFILRAPAAYVVLGMWLAH